MLGDNISIKPEAMDLETMLRRARKGTLPHCPGGPFRELIGQRAYRLEFAESIINAALAENRACTPEERTRIESLMAEAAEIAPVIKEVWERERQELMAPIRETSRA